MQQIGFIGLGIMGKPMCMNLLRAGLKVTAYTRTPKKATEIMAAGGVFADSPAAVAAQSDMVITMVPDAPDVRKVCLGPGGIAAGARHGMLYVDMSSIDPIVSKELAAALGEHGIRMLDAPVSGGEPKAVDGTLSIMVGGAEEDYAEAAPVLRLMGTSVMRMGDIDAGNVTKLANNIRVALHIAAMAEALTLAAKAGVAPSLVFQAVRGGLAGSTVLEAKAPMVLERNFTPGFRIDLHAKDLRNALSLAHGVDAPLPLAALVMESMQSIKAQGKGALDHGALVQFYEKLANVTVEQ